MEVASTLLDVVRKTPLSILALGAILSPVFLIACLAVYRLFFHPLSKIPGRLSQKLSGFPRTWHCRQGNRFLREMETHDRYGSVIRIAPNALCFNTLSALQTVYTKDSNVFKGDEFYGLLDGGAEGGCSIMTEADNTAHAARRRVLDKSLPLRDQAFRDLNALSKSFASVVFQEGSADDKGWSKTIDVAPVSAWFSFDLIGTIAFGSPLDMLHEKEYRWVPKCLQSARIFLFWGGDSPFLNFWQWVWGTSIPSILRLQTLQDAQRYADFADWMFHRRAEKLNTEDDLEPRRADIFQGLLRSELYNDWETRAGKLFIDCRWERRNFQNVAGEDGIIKPFSKLAEYAVNNAAINAVQLAGYSIIVGSGDRTVHILNLDTGAVVKKFNAAAGVADMHFNGRLLIAACSDGSATVWDMDDDTVKTRIEGPRTVARAVDAVEDGQGNLVRLAIGKYDGTVQIYALDSNSDAWLVTNTLEYGIQPVRISDDNPYVNSCTEAERVFDVAFREERVYCCGQGNFVVGWNLPGNT